MAAPKLPGDPQHVEQLGSWFTIDVRGIKGSFTDISGLAIDMEVVEQQVSSAAGKPVSTKRPGNVKYGDITIKRHLSPDRSFYDWMQEVVAGKLDKARTNGTIALHNKDGSVAGRWEFNAAWPSKWSASDLDVGTDDPMTEEITLAIEGLKRVVD